MSPHGAMCLGTEKDVNTHIKAPLLPLAQAAGGQVPREAHSQHHSPTTTSSHGGPATDAANGPRPGASGTALLCSTRQNRDREAAGISGAKQSPCQDLAFPGPARFCCCRVTSPPRMLLSPPLPPQALLPPSAASDPHVSCTPPAPGSLAEPFNPESLLICCPDPSRPPASFLRVPYFPLHPYPPNSPHSLLPQASGPPRLSPASGASPRPQSAGSSQASSPQNSFRELPTHSSGIPPTSSPLRQTFPFTWYGLPHPQGPLAPCPEDARTPPPASPFGASRPLISLLGTP